VKKSPKVVIVGLDAATWTLIRPWIKEGSLPNLAKLVTDGVSGPLRSVLPPITPPAWTSFMTGKNPGKHGIYNFVQNEPGVYAMSYCNGGARRSKTIWKLMNEAGLSVGTMNIPFTYPPEELNGFQISGFDTPSSDSSPFVYPPSLHSELKANVGKIVHDLRYLGAMSTDERRRHCLAEMEQLDQQWASAALYLLEHHPQDVMMFVFMSIDTVQHYFWHYMDPDHFLHDAQADKQFHRAVRTTYERLDAALGHIIEKVPAESNVFVVSDHGGGPVSDRTIFLNRYLAQIGLLHYRNGNTSSFAGIGQKVIRKGFAFLRASLSARQKQLLAHLFPALRQQAELAFTSFNLIDWSRTKAYCSEVLAAPPSISVNLKGAKPTGIVDEGEYDDLLNFIIDKLQDLKDPRTGEPVIKRIYRREEIFQGPCADQGADLVLDWWSDDSRFSTQPSFPEETDKPPLIVRERRPPTESEWGGTHTLHGILVARGPAFKKALAIENARLIDIAPTILYLLGVPIPEDFDGKVLEDALRPEVLRTKAVRGAASSVAPRESVNGYSDEEAAKVEERLQALGYLE